MMTHYVHTQIGYFLLVVYGVLILIVGSLVGGTGGSPFPLTGLIVLLIASVTFSTLRVRVDQEMIHIRFGPGVFSKTFPLSEIETHEVVRNPWYYGLGIRYTPRGWLFSVSGLSAIEIQLKSGKRYRIGTDDPEGLSTGISEALRSVRG
jgi:hypothetical protein